MNWYNYVLPEDRKRFLSLETAYCTAENDILSSLLIEGDIIKIEAARARMLAKRYLFLAEWIETGE